MSFFLGSNQYGKAGIRLVSVQRDGDRHLVTDFTVATALAGHLDDTHFTGDNSAVLPTDTQKNTVYAFAREFGVGEPEAFALRLAKHFVTTQEAIYHARVNIEQHTWERLAPHGEPAPHSFVRAGTETRRAEVIVTEDDVAVSSGLGDLTLLNTTNSEFHGFPRDKYTTLPETRERMLATSVEAWWDHDSADVDWGKSYAEARDALLTAFASTYSLSLQQTLFSMGSYVLHQCPSVDEIRLSLPNKHHHLVDLTPFGLDNPDQVYVAPTEPYGLIQGTVQRHQMVPTVGPQLW
ncbi:factor-independent urate hydroxylase [Cryptosporangium aurantiacum]|uniref:Uricase n=1 Tax=Cryptosporangium aurantiacum TaxID=134849 RepID=A0A1M7QCM5_9ACTN|nr:urate oxidase [Cryptosporangium aurantiacum]SHN28547.1 urate oxidase [Cryptosporangium aurantiacum]